MCPVKGTVQSSQRIWRKATRSLREILGWIASQNCLGSCGDKVRMKVHVLPYICSVVFHITVSLMLQLFHCLQFEEGENVLFKKRSLISFCAWQPHCVCFGITLIRIRIKRQDVLLKSRKWREFCGLDVMSLSRHSVPSHTLAWFCVWKWRLPDVLLPHNHRKTFFLEQDQTECG